MGIKMISKPIQSAKRKNLVRNCIAKTVSAFNGSIKYRLLLFFILFALIPLTILGAVSYSASKTTIDSKVRDYSERLIKQTAENIDFRFSRYQDTMIQIITNPEIIAILKNIDDPRSNPKGLESLPLTTKLAYYIATSPEFKSVSFISRNHYIRGIWWTRGVDSRSPLYRDTMDGGNKFQWFPTHVANFADSAGSGDENVFTLTKQVFNLVDGDSLGVVAFIDIREEILSDICRQSVNGLPIQCFVIDQNGMIVAHPDNRFLFKNSSRLFGGKGLRRLLKTTDGVISFSGRYQNQKAIINAITLESTNWRVVNIIDNSYFYKESNRVIRAIWVMAVLCILVAILAAFLLTQRITTPLQKMLTVMDQVVAGNLSARIAENSAGEDVKDEFTILRDNFNFMIAKTEELVQKVYTEQNGKRVAEIKALQMQINPHFLYNTLDTIKWTALFQKANNAAEMANLLSRLLHISLGKGEETVSVADEIEHVRCYLGIQKFRFNFNIEVRYDIAKETLALKTPKLILQPIVENAILHGLADKPEGGMIMITAASMEGKLRFEVIDNGCGIERDVIENFNESQRKTGEIMSGIGLANIDERIRLICGPEYGLRIFSVHGQETKVEIWLPIFE
jgi:two-component system, sensor histidine kinase YesM